MYSFFLEWCPAIHDGDTDDEEEKEGNFERSIDSDYSVITMPKDDDDEVWCNQIFLKIIFNIFMWLVFLFYIHTHCCKITILQTGQNDVIVNFIQFLNGVEMNMVEEITPCEFISLLYTLDIWCYRKFLLKQS